MAEEKGCSILERLREIAHIELVGDEKEIVCRDIERIADYLGQVSSALEELGVDPEPLYHVGRRSRGLGMVSTGRGWLV